MRELEASLQPFGEFLLKAQLARPQIAPYFVRWVRRFLSRPASTTQRYMHLSPVATEDAIRLLDTRLVGLNVGPQCGDIVETSAAGSDGD